MEEAKHGKHTGPLRAHGNGLTGVMAAGCTGGAGTAPATKAVLCVHSGASGLQGSTLVPQHRVFVGRNKQLLIEKCLTAF